MRSKFSLAVFSIFALFSLISSCKKDNPEDENPNPPGQNDTLSGEWEAITGNISNIPAGLIFEVNGTVIHITQPMQPFGGRAFKLQGADFTPIFECDDNGFLLSHKQKGNAEVYVMEDQTTSTGGFGATYDYEYQLYRINQNGGTPICKVPNTSNLDMADYQLWMDNNELYWGGTSNTSGQISFNAYKLSAADTFQLVYSEPYEARANLIDANNGVYLLSYTLINGNYSNYFVRKFSNGQFSTIYTGGGSQLMPVIFGNRFYGLEIFYDYMDYTASYVKLKDLQSGTQYSIALQKSYVKFSQNRRDGFYISVAFSNNSTDNSYVIINENGIRILPEKVSNLSEIEQRFMRLVEFTESPTYYYRLSENANELILLRLAK